MVVVQATEVQHTMARKSLFQTRPSEITRRLEDFRNRNLKKAKISTLKSELGNLMEDYVSASYPIQASSVYRVRKNKEDKLFKHKDCVWYPKPEFITTLGRCNNVGSPVFYCCDSKDTAVIEVKPTVGEHLTILKCELKDQNLLPVVMPLGVYERTGIHNPKLGIRSLEDELNRRGGLSKEAIRKNLKINSFLTEQFTKYVTYGNEHEYKITVALCELILGSNTLAGVCYPSIAGGGLAVNIALTTNAVDKLYKPVSCQLVRVTQVYDNPGCQVDMLLETESIKDDGEIIWKSPESMAVYSSP